MRKFTLGLLLGCVLGMGALALANSRQAAATQRFPQFENSSVKVWRTVVQPDAPTSMHRHDHPRIIIPLQSGTMKLTEQNGTATTHVWEQGKAYWAPANPPNTLHADVNAGGKVIEVMVVELLNEK